MHDFLLQPLRDLAFNVHSAYGRAAMTAFTLRRPSPWRLLVAAVSSGEGQPDEQRLIWRLLNNYDPAARPVYNASHTVTVKFGYTLTQIADMVRPRYARVRWTGAWLCAPTRMLIEFMADNLISFAHFKHRFAR